jgi:hypothetical protein
MKKPIGTEELPVLNLRAQILTTLITTASKLDINQPDVMITKADKLWEWVIKPLADEKK